MSAGNTDYGRVAVLYGGSSAEREVSLRSGAAALDALRSAGVDAHGFDFGPQTLDALRDGGFATVFIALHGRGGEDGTVQGALELLGLPYTGSRVLGSALAMDKLRAKQSWRGVGLPTPAFERVGAQTDWSQLAVRLSLPLMLKPTLEGSSVGISKVLSAAELPAAYELASRCNSPVLAEQFVSGAEYTVGIVGTTVLPPIRLETPRTFYDYAAKYTANDTRYHCPCGLPRAQEEAMQRLAWSAFEALGCSGWGRVDLMLPAQGADPQPQLIEVNTVPGLTDHSLVPMAARAVGWSFPELARAILASASAPATGAVRYLPAGDAGG